MKYWITKFVIIIILLYILILNTDYAAASQLDHLDVQQFNVIAEVENFGKRWREASKATDKLVGLFTLHEGEESGKIYLEIKPEQLNKNYLATVTLESGIGESGIYSGLPLNDFLFYFRRVNQNLHFVVRNVKFRTEPSEPEQRSLARSFSDSVLFSLPIEKINPDSKSILIDLDHLLMQDFPGLTPLLKYSLDADYRLDNSKSYFGEIHSFPENLEIDAIYGFSSLVPANLITLPDSRALSLKVHYSFSLLKENNNYIPRLADDRVGYFITAFQNFADQNAPELFVRYINRWHLEPSNPDAPLSPPKQPIVFWIENAVPLSYRDAIREGVLMWNKAFEKAGFENAIEVRQMPDDADWQPADVRYNTIRWFNSVDAGFARGPVRVNPFTGEILDADIIVDANMVRSIQHEYRAMMEIHAQTNQCHNSISAKHLQNLLADSEICYGIESTEQVAMGALALSLLQNTTPNSEVMQKYVHQYLRSLIAHEVGHTLGLRHNFHGSSMLAPEDLNNLQITHTKGLVSSVMDYLPVNIAPQGVQQGDYFPEIIGPYDEWAIMYGYKPNPNLEIEKSFLEQIALASPQPELFYATDEDIWDINPLANLWDLSSNVLLYSQWQMDNARVMWQKLDQHYLAPGESYSHLRDLFNKILKHYFRNANLIVQYIGGQSFQRLHVSDDPSWAFVPVTLEEQRQALTKLQEYVFAEDAFDFSPQLLNQLAPSRWQHWGNYIPHNRLDYPIHERIIRFQSEMLHSLLDSDRLNRLRDIEFKSQPGQALSMPELFDTLQQSIWTEVITPETPQLISSLRRSLQQEHLDVLLEIIKHPTDKTNDSQTLAWYELHQLQTAIDLRLQKCREQLDTYTIAHLEYTSDRISKTFRE